MALRSSRSFLSFSPLATLFAVATIACGSTAASTDQGDAAGSDASPIAIDAAAHDETATPDDTGATIAVDSAPADTIAPDTAVADTNVPDTAPVDHGSKSTTFPAFKPIIAQLVDNGGGVNVNPVIVTVTWQGDPAAAQLEAFGDTIGASDYWRDTTSEYGVGKAVSGPANHVRLTTPPTTNLDDPAIEKLITDNIQSKAFPAPTPSTIYSLYFPVGTHVLYNGKDACRSIGGYHTAFSWNGSDIAYAVTLPCAGGSFNERTITASHELIEAVTDPHPNAGPAFWGFDADSASWEIFNDFQDETGDACEFYDEANIRTNEPTFAYVAQRTWSNKSAAAGHHPCVPQPLGPYYNVTALPGELEDVIVDMTDAGGNARTHTKGIKVALGQTRTFPVGFYSDRDTGWSWSLDIMEDTPNTSSTPTQDFDLSLDVGSGYNGEKAYVTVKANKVPARRAQIVTLLSSHAGVMHYMPILIGVTQ